MLLIHCTDHLFHLPGSFSLLRSLANTKLGPQARIQDPTTGGGKAQICTQGSPLCAIRDLRFRGEAMAPLLPPVYGPVGPISFEWLVLE